MGEEKAHTAVLPENVVFVAKTEQTIAQTTICFLNGSENSGAGPLPVLIAYGRTADTGPWVGDIISVGDSGGETCSLLKEIYLDWQSEVYFRSHTMGKGSPTVAGEPFGHLSEVNLLYIRKLSCKLSLISERRGGKYGGSC